MSFGIAAKLLVWTAAASAAVFRPAMAEASFHRLEELARRAARHRTATWLASGLLVLLASSPSL